MSKPFQAISSSVFVIFTLLFFVPKNQADTIHDRYLLCQDKYNAISGFGIVLNNSGWKLITASESSYGEIDTRMEKTSKARIFRYTFDEYFLNFILEEDDKVVSTLILDRFNLELEIFNGEIRLPKVLQPRNVCFCKVVHSEDELERAIEHISQKFYDKKRNVRNRKL